MAVDLAHLANLRDVASADPAALRAGVLYRSEAPQPGDVSPTDVAWPPRTVVDLRTSGERVHAHPLAALGTVVVDVPMVPALAPEVPTPSEGTGNPIDRVYLDALVVADTWLPALLTAVARSAAPVLVHCAAGKDRTGIAVALLLLLAGADRAAVEADYAATELGLPGVHARLDLAGERDGRPVARHTGVAPTAIAAILDELGTDATGFALAHGGDEADLAAWRERIRLPGSA